MKKNSILVLFFLIGAICSQAQNIKISDMTSASDLTGTVYVPIIQGGSNKKWSLNALPLPTSAGGTGITAFGTGVATALGVNIGSAGAFTTFNGAAGTPSSLTLTNATGLPPTTGISGWPANASGVLTNNGSGTLSWGSSGLTIGSTSITSGTTTRVLYDNAGTLGEYTTIPVANGGTNLSSYTTGDLLYASGSTTLSKLGIGTASQIIRTNSGATAPEWYTPTANPMTAQYDMIVGGVPSSGIAPPTRLAVGSDAQTIRVVSGVPTYSSDAGWLTPLKVSGSDATTTGASLVDITGLVTGTLTGATQYEIEAILYITTSADTNGQEFGIGMGGSGSAAVVNVILTGTTTSTGATSQTINAAATASSAMNTTSAASGTIIIKGIVTTRGTSPTISIQHLKVTSGTSTVKIGSVLKYRIL